MDFSVVILKPQGYCHSDAFLEVAETLQSGLRTLGHTADITHAPIQGRRSLVLGAHLLPQTALSLPDDAVIYNLEQIEETSAWMTPELLALYRSHVVWDYSRANLQRLATLGVNRTALVPIGYAPVLTRIPAQAADIDVLFYGSLNQRRRVILEGLGNKGVRVQAVFGSYGKERDQLISRSKLVLNVHFYQAKVFEIVRVSYLLANRRTVVSERGALPEEEEPFERGVAFAQYDGLVATCMDLLANAERRDQIAAAGFSNISVRPVEMFLQPALDALPEAIPVNTYYSFPRPEVVELVEPRGKRILDIGCAAGAMGAAMLAGGAESVVGIEIVREPAKMARTRLSGVHSVDLNQDPALPFPDGYFDCITFADVLEHLVDPEGTLRHLRRYLAPEGTIVCSIPNVRHESVVLPLLALGQWEYQEAGILDRTHLRFFTRTSLIGLLERSGYSIVGPMRAVTSPPSPHVERFAEIVASVGGDAAAYRAEATTIQFLMVARPVSSATYTRPARVPDLWEGASPVRILFAPQFHDPADSWESRIRELAREARTRSNVTIGIAAPPQVLQPPPPALEQIALDNPGLDLALIEAPTDPDGWRRLLSGTAVFVTTSPRPDLEILANEVGSYVEPRANASGAPSPRSG